MNHEAIYTFGTGKSTLDSMEGSSPSIDNHVPGPNAYTLPGTNNSPNWRYRFCQLESASHSETSFRSNTGHLSAHTILKTAKLMYDHFYREDVELPI